MAGLDVLDVKLGDENDNESIIQLAREQKFQYGLLPSSINKKKPSSDLNCVVEEILRNANG